MGPLCYLALQRLHCVTIKAPHTSDLCTAASLEVNEVLICPVEYKYTPSPCVGLLMGIFIFECRKYQPLIGQPPILFRSIHLRRIHLVFYCG